MKILFVAADVNRIGGIEKYNRDFVEALGKAGVEVFLIESRGIDFARKVIFVLRVIFERLRRSPHILLCSHINYSPICYYLKRVIGGDYVVTLYGIEAMGITNSLKLRSVAEAKTVIVISDYTKGHVLAQFPQLQERVFMLPSAVDGARFFVKDKPHRLVEMYGLAGYRVILTVARLSSHEHKGYDRVIRALPMVLEEFPRTKYLLVGGGKDERVDALLEDARIREHVILTGVVAGEDLVDYYNLADVFVMPSKYEGFGIVFIEALACGTSVIASNKYGCREGLLNGELGMVVDPDNPREIAGAICRVFKGDIPGNLWDRRKLRQKCLEVYGIEGFGARVMDLVRRIGGSPHLTSECVRVRP